MFCYNLFLRRLVIFSCLSLSFTFLLSVTALMAVTGIHTQPYLSPKISQKSFKDCNFQRRSSFRFFSTKQFSNNQELSKAYSAQKVERRASVFLTRAASVGSSGQYSEPLVGDSQTTQKGRRRTIAGVDQEDLLDPGQLADPDSLFCELNGVDIHHKIYHHGEQSEVETSDIETKKIGLPMVLLHGFGASVFSWEKVMKPLARLTGSKVLAFDRPAFGLTSRLRELEGLNVNPYSMAFSVLATISFIDMLGSDKAILMGHSAGSLVAVSTYFEAPEKVAALILIAPAIVAPIMSKKVKEKGTGSDSVPPDNPFARAWRAFLEFCKWVAGITVGMLKRMGEMIGSLYNRALAAVLRSSLAVMLIRMIIDKFGVPAVRNAWCDPNQVADDVLQGYTKPLRVKDWERGLLEFSIAMITDSSSKPPLSDRLHEISCPVLIVTGDRDRLVPAWNAERLSKAIPGSRFEVIKNCGHLPHEERVEEFLTIVERFLQSVFAVQATAQQA